MKESTVFNAAQAGLQTPGKKHPKDAETMHESLSDYEDICADIYCEAVNYGLFQPDLKDMPYEIHSDLAVIYYLEKVSEEGIITAPLTFELIKKLGMDEEEIRNTAWRNTLLKKRAVMMPLSEVLDCECDEDGVTLYVLTNENMYLGAVTILYPDLLDMIADKLGSDLYILPSSIHECLLLPEHESIDGADLRSLVKKVNDSEVGEGEILSYNVYKYSRSDRSVTIDNE